MAYGRKGLRTSSHAENISLCNSSASARRYRFLPGHTDVDDFKSRLYGSEVCVCVCGGGGGHPEELDRK